MQAKLATDNTAANAAQVPVVVFTFEQAVEVMKEGMTVNCECKYDEAQPGADTPEKKLLRATAVVSYERAMFMFDQLISSGELRAGSLGSAIETRIKVYGLSQKLSPHADVHKLEELRAQAVAENQLSPNGTPAEAPAPLTSVDEGSAAPAADDGADSGQDAGRCSRNSPPKQYPNSAHQFAAPGATALCRPYCLVRGNSPCVGRT